MAMTVLNNTAAMMTLGELNKNITKVGKDLKKISTGERVTGAGDDASAYSISERMRAKIRSLKQDVDNVKNGRSLLKVAAGGIDSIVDELRNLKELALNAANDSNTDEDRAIIQKEFDQKMANINAIASETNYNGKILLDGRYGRKAVSSSDTSPTPSDVVATSWVASQAEPTGTPILITSGNYTIAADGVYMFATGYQGTVTIANGVQNVKLQQQTPSVALDHTFIVGPSSGNANLWVEDLNIQNNFDSTYPKENGDVKISPAIQFKGTNNYLTLKGTNTFSRALDRDFIETNGSSFLHGYPIIDAALGLTIESSGNSSINVFDNPTFIRMQSTNQGWYGPPYPYAATATGAGIGYTSTDEDTYIEINGGNINVDMAHGISDSELSTYYNQFVSAFNGMTGINSPQSRMGEDFGESAGIGGRGSSQTSSDFYGDIIINDGAIVSRTVNGAGIGSNGYCSSESFFSPAIRDIIINGGSITASSYLGDDVGAGYNGAIRNLIQNANNSNSNSNGNRLNGDTSENSNKTYICNPLVIHHGTKANQALNCCISDMRTDALGLTDTKVSTRNDAVWALSDDTTNPPRVGAIDAAIEYALNESTTIGSYISRLELTEENLVTASENTQFSESTIRDADMAKEMMSYTKNNVLSQASQSMLAQANQNSSNVLSLLQ